MAPTGLYARHARTNEGWAADVRLTVAQGRIATLATNQPASPGDVEVGVLVPGLANAHSHAFQRALVGHTEHRVPAIRDTFWTWRRQMYALTRSLTAPMLQAIAAQAYAEMLAAGYTAVAEFHYLHRADAGPAACDTMFEAIAAAAEQSGIRLTYVPVLYERAGFSEPAPTLEQKRFALHGDDFMAHYTRARTKANGRLQVGIGAHSLRAVSPASLQHVAQIARQDRVPMHIHIAEQLGEVDDCVVQRGRRPVAWLLDNHDIDSNWCLVHATHVDPAEVEALADTGCVVCLCPTTEANLGDGLFPVAAFLERGGRIAIGSDSHVSIDPFEELRWLEYGQRLITRQRNIAATTRTSTGESLFALAHQGGNQACGTVSNRLQIGDPADLVAFDERRPTLAGHSTQSLLDALIFSGHPKPVDRVMIDGEWVVVDGRHVRAPEIEAAYTRTVDALWSDEAHR